MEALTILSPAFERTQTEAADTHTLTGSGNGVRVGLLDNGKPGTTDPLFGSLEATLRGRYGITNIVRASKPNHQAAVSRDVFDRLMGSADLIITAIAD